MQIYVPVQILYIIQIYSKHSIAERNLPAIFFRQKLLNSNSYYATETALVSVLEVLVFE